MLNQFIAGNTIGEVSRNSLDANAQDEQARQATANLLLNQMIAYNQRANERDRNATANSDINQRYGYLGNQLASNERLSGNDLAFRRAAMMQPYQQQTAADAARNELLKQQLQIQADALKQNPFGGNPSLQNEYFRHTEADNKAQRDAEGAAAALNQFTIGKFNDLATPVVAERLDSGADNPGFNGFLGGMWAGNAAKAAPGVIGTGVLPDGYATDNAVKGTVDWWNSPNNDVKAKLRGVAAQAAAQEHPDLGSMAQWDGQKYVPKPQTTPFMGGAFNLMARQPGAAAPVAGSNTNALPASTIAPQTAALIQSAQAAITRGADPAAVRARLQSQYGLTLP